MISQWNRMAGLPGIAPSLTWALYVPSTALSSELRATLVCLIRGMFSNRKCIFSWRISASLKGRVYRRAASFPTSFTCSRTYAAYFIAKPPSFLSKPCIAAWMFVCHFPMGLSSASNSISFASTLSTRFLYSGNSTPTNNVQVSYTLGSSAGAYWPFLPFPPFLLPPLEDLSWARRISRLTSVR